MTPYEFLKLLEIEGIPMESCTGNYPIRFTKAVPMRAGYKICGDLYNEYGDDTTPLPCRVKENTPEASIETLLVPTSFLLKHTITCVSPSIQEHCLPQVPEALVVGNS